MTSTGLGRALVEGLIAAEIPHVVVCPGSRSTSVALAVAAAAADGRIQLHTRTDERVGGFLALGLARASGSAAIVVTSGTAVGNLMPAVMEARASGVCLVVITADRPGTLVGSGANQTTRQAGIFGHHVVDDLGLASTDGAPKAWAAQLPRVLACGLGLRTRRPGPVHINAAFTEPFIGEPEEEPAEPRLRTIVASRPAVPTRLTIGPRTVILAGDAPAAVGYRARALAESARLPLFAEPSSNARAGDCAIAGYRMLLDTALASRIERVVVYGHPTLSRPVLRLLSRDDIELIVVADRADWPDPGWSATQICDEIDLAPDDRGWLQEWQSADRQLIEPSSVAHRPQTSSDRSTVANRALSGQGVADAVVASHPPNLVFGASNLIRNADLSPIAELSSVADQQSGTERCVCWANRGLAGIDGVISTAIGIALGTGRPTTVLIGDLGFLHDIGSLHLPTGQPVPDLRIVVADDNGGSIFSTLEIADSPDYQKLFAMPHGRDLGALAEGFGWPIRRPGDLVELIEALAQPVRGIEVLVAVLGA